jgi:hypothetical protein
MKIDAGKSEVNKKRKYTLRISLQPNFDSIITVFCEIRIAKQTSNSKF